MSNLNRRPVLVVSGSASAIPSSSEDGFKVQDAKFVRTFIDFTGEVSACVIRKLTRNRSTGSWYIDVSTEDTDPLVPGDGDTIRYWEVVPGDEITFQIVSVTGGTVSVYAHSIFDSE